MPRYRQFLMLLSIHVFRKANVDVAVYETFCGGEYDCTNVVRPVVMGITTLALDYVRMLGPSLQDVAWHKAGIFNSNTPAFSGPQDSLASKVLELRALEKGILLKFVPRNPLLPTDAQTIKPDALKINASLATTLANSYLERSTHLLSTQDKCGGIENFLFPGRFQQIVRLRHDSPTKSTDCGMCPSA